MKGTRLQNGAPWFSRVPKSAVFVLLVALLANLVACKRKEIGIPFETLVQGEPQLLDNQDWNYVVHYERVDLMVATDPAEAQNIADRLSPERPGMRLKEIADVDYGEYLVVAAYFGTKPHGGFAITIEKITQAGHDVNVVVSTVEPTGGDTTVIHPIHAVKIKRADLPVKGHLVFRLWKEDEVVLTREHSVP